MRQSQLFTHTLRQAPAEADVVSHQLLLRAGFVRPLAAGIFSSLPLAVRALARIETIIREEMDAIGGQEIRMPVVHPADVWKETGRWYQIGPEMARFQDRAGRDMVLAMTHEEIVTDLARKEIRSYRQLPQLVYQLQTKFRDEPRSRAGLIRVREFTMKDSYSLDTDWDGLDKQYRAHYQAYFNIFRRCGLPVVAVRSDVGMMGGRVAHEFMYLTPIGEDTLFFCDASGYAANREVATFRKPPAAPAAALPLEKVSTPGTTTIDSLASFLNIPAAQTAKAVFVAALLADGEAERLVVALIRGDLDVNETKLQNVLQARTLRPATEEEIRAADIVPGYGSAICIQGPLVVADDSVVSSPNLVAGANEAGYHYLNSNYERDYRADIVADIAAAREGDLSPDGAGPLRAARGVEVANIFKLGTRYSDALGATFQDQDGTERPIVMGSYGIGVGRLLGCLAEHYNDADGLKWPITVAPYAVHLLLVSAEDAQSAEVAERLYAELRASGLDVLYDDRAERPGVKFKDADLIGLPLRVAVGTRGLAQGGVELKRRDEPTGRVVPLDELVPALRAQIAALHAAIDATVTPVVFVE